MTEAMIDDTLGCVTRKKLNIYFIVDTSGSMGINGRIQSLNQAAITVLPELKDASDQNPQADVHFRVLEFNTKAQWLSAEAKPMREYGQSWHWTDLEPSGTTSFGAALALLADALQPEKLGSFLYPPVLVLLSDGAPTDDWESALARFNETPYGRKPNLTVRAAMAVTGADRDVLTRFTGNVEYVVDVTNPTKMMEFLRWATISLSKGASMSRALAGDAGAVSPSAPIIVAPPTVDDDDDVF